jgi:hypothetical protein
VSATEYNGISRETIDRALAQANAPREPGSMAEFAALGVVAAEALPTLLDRITALETEHERIRAALNGYRDSDLASLAEYYARRNDALEQENERLQARNERSSQLLRATSDGPGEAREEVVRLRAALAALRREVDWLRYHANKILPDDEPDFTKEARDA